MPTDLPSFDDVRRASERLSGEAVRTPLVRSAILDERAGRPVLLKAEVLQRTGSFKFRGAYNAIASLDADARAKGVVACSSGNHAQGVAEAARLFGVRATIVMPADAPALKVARTKRSGAHVVTYDRVNESREEIALRIVAETGADFVPPYDDRRVISGQGTVGIEIAEQAEALGLDPARILVPCSGGGLSAGIALAAEALMPWARVTTVEPEAFDDHARSFRSGEREGNTARSGSICDALLADRPGEITFAVNRPRVPSGLAVSDDEVRTAMRFAFEELKLVVEPGGAVGLAAVLAGRLDEGPQPVVVVLSGGNAGPSAYAEAIGG
ncbi:threonine ammonia-lyase [Lutibaculum baratangense]|uniref:Threonine dehydratase, catabolic n=1 Tax=Lutibaculum baratangense AMV1 TaxID=631454 RepID=V4RDJ4_9HYPH|nr:threonine/serine dehydratase [Lutibaculum baratangense]ESR24236.1 Threonine dehydratase, catabolic [Lutibaculum baratangense AMV1]